MSATQEELAFVIGALYGDGCFAHKDQNGRVHFGSIDKEFIENVINKVNSLFDLKLKIRVDKLSQKNRKWKDFYSFSSRRLYKKLEEFDFKITRSLPQFIRDGSMITKASWIYKGYKPLKTEVT